MFSVLFRLTRCKASSHVLVVLVEAVVVVEIKVVVVGVAVVSGDTLYLRFKLARIPAFIASTFRCNRSILVGAG